MVEREYGAAYAPASKPIDDGPVSPLSTSERPFSEYQPYRPALFRPPSNNWPSQSSISTPPDRAPSWIVSRAELQQLQEAIPPEQPASEPLPSPPPHMEPSLFGSRDVPDTPYQENVAWANSTTFRSTLQESPKPDIQRRSLVVTAEEVPWNSRRYFRHPRRIPTPWETGVWLRFPWWGLGSLVVILILTSVSAIVIFISNGTSTNDWKVGNDYAQPYVYISAFEMAMDFLILFALAEGIVIRFWRQLLHGTTLAAIHDTYNSGHLWPAAKQLAKLHPTTVAVACILSAITFIRGPILQGALTLDATGRTDVQEYLNLRIAPYPIVQYLQSNHSDPRNQGRLTEAFTSLLKDVNAGKPMPYTESLDQCGSYCTGYISGFAFKSECTSTTQPFDLSNLPEDCKACVIVSGSSCAATCSARQKSEFNPVFFSVGYEQTGDALILKSTHKDKGSCNGTVQVQTCRLTQVASGYPIVFANGTIDRSEADPSAPIYDYHLPLDPQLIQKYWPLAFETLFPPMSINVTPKPDFSQLQYNKCVQSETADTTRPFNSTASCSTSPTLDSRLLTTDPSILYATQTTASPNEDPLCALTWRDPMQEMITKLQSLAFRITVAMATTDPSTYAPTYTSDDVASLRATWTKSVLVNGYRIQPIYRVTPGLVAFGILLSVIGVASVVPLYNGFWELGRNVSLNPLEIARAFGAPVMDGLDGNAGNEIITFERGGMSVKYGALERYGEGKTLRVEEATRATIRTPWKGEILG